MAEKIIFIGVSDGSVEPNFFNHYTRTEAIERTAKAMCKEDTGVEWEDMGFVSQHIYKDLAEFALDGLLEAYRNE